jgi:hypothetical protein
MEHNRTHEIGISVALIALFIVLLNPFHLWMPDMMHLLLLALGVVVFGAYAVFVMRERALDERDGVYRMRSGRAAFLVGAGALVCGILYESGAGSVDIWLVFVLVLMVVTKVGVHFYSDRYS